MSPDKILAISNYPIPKNTTEVKQLIGLAGWYRRFFDNFASICSPITDLLKGKKKGQPIIWTEEANNAFNIIKIN